MTKSDRLEAWLDAHDMTLMTPEGFEEALVGVAQVFNTCIAIYDRAKCVEILQTRDGMTEEAAEEFFEFNTQGSYIGQHTPGFLIWRADEVEQ